MLDETVGYEGRKWLESYDTHKETQDVQTNKGENNIKFCSYHVFAQSQYQQEARHAVPKSWEKRSVTLSLEIISYDADIISLQDADHFYDYWKRTLSLLGYDTVYQQRTEIRGSHDEGVIIAYKRSLFQLYKSIPVELNNSADRIDDLNLKDRVVTDDVGLILLLQPWGDEGGGKVVRSINSSLCVSCAMFSDKEGDSDVRLEQAKYLMRTIEQVNSTFQVPVLLGISMHDEPSSPCYHLLRFLSVSILSSLYCHF
jgi:mRNA deadenylase 3'-5' endonuclease subunit Ccr4